MKTKIFFADLDGTLLNDQKQITELTHRKLESFLKNGNYFSICTGRPINSALEVFQSLKLPSSGCYIISYNGAQIYDCASGQTVVRYAVSEDLIATVFELAESYGLHCQTYTDTHILSKADNEATAYYQKNIHMPLCVTDDIQKSLDVPPCKLMVIELHDHEKLERFRIDLKARVGERLQLMYSNPNYLEIFSAEAGKGTSVKALCQMLQIPIENSFAAGDQQNDLSMIQAAGLGIAMCNGNEEVKRQADVVTALDNNHDGLAPFLE